MSDDQLQKLVETAVIHSPNSFNMQQSRAVLVTGDMHHRVWDTVVENQIKSFADDSESHDPQRVAASTEMLVRSEEHVEGFKKKVDSTYRPGYGTILFFESHKIIEDWGKKMPNYSKVGPDEVYSTPVVRVRADGY